MSIEPPVTLNGLPLRYSLSFHPASIFLLSHVVLLSLAFLNVYCSNMSFFLQHWVDWHELWTAPSLLLGRTIAFWIWFKFFPPSWLLWYCFQFWSTSKLGWTFFTFCCGVGPRSSHENLSLVTAILMMFHQNLKLPNLLQTLFQTTIPRILLQNTNSTRKRILHTTVRAPRHASARNVELLAVSSSYSSVLKVLFLPWELIPLTTSLTLGHQIPTRSLQVLLD